MFLEQEMMKLLSSIKVATIATTALTLAVLPTIAQDTPATFPDIDENVYKTEIEEAVKMGIVEGFPDGTFQPDNQVTREEAAVMITKAIGNVTPIDLNSGPTNRTIRPFKDVAADRWSAKEINWLQWNLYPANTAQLTGNFRPADPITRVELVEFLRRTGEFLGSRLNGNPDLPQPLEPIEFTDVVGYDKVLTLQMSAFCQVASPLNEEGDEFAPTEQAHRDYTAAALVRALNCE